MNRVSAALAVALIALAPGSAVGSGTVVRSVRLVRLAAAVVIVVEADGALPVPTVGVLDGPPRIYLDLQEVTTAVAGVVARGDEPVRRVRVGLYQAQPPVTRVVIDLMRAVPYRIAAGAREQGQLTLALGPAGAEATAALPHVARPPDPAGSAAVDLPPPSLPAAAIVPAAGEAAKDVGRYVKQISVHLARLERLRPVLASLDSLTPVSALSLRSAVGEFESIRQFLVATDPPRALNAAHEMLGTACLLGAVAARTGLEAIALGDSARARDAAAAAAGAIMLLELARADLGFAPGGSGEEPIIPEILARRDPSS